MRQVNDQERLEIVRLLLNHSTYKATSILNSKANIERTVSRSTVTRIRSRMINVGNIHRKKRSDINSIRKPFWIPRMVRRYFSRHPHTTLKKAAWRFRMCEKTILKIIKRVKFHAYKCNVTQELYDGDEAKRKLSSGKTINSTSSDSSLSNHGFISQ